jgi:hypothetical protein
MAPQLAAAAPHIVTAAKTEGPNPILGEGAHKYECNHHWAQLPEKYTWQTTHNVAIDSNGLVYITHEGRIDQPDHPAIFVFDDAGKFVRAFGQLFQGGCHGIEIRREGSEDFVYVTGFQTKRFFAKYTPAGELVWQKFAPMQTGFFAEGEEVAPRKKDDNPWGQHHFMPTNYAWHPDGGFYLADGYGSYRVHRYDKDANYMSSIGSPSGKDNEDGTFELPHGLWVDNRADAQTPTLVVADRANNRLQWFTLEGQHLRTQNDFLLPANCDIHGDLLLVPELLGRVTLLGADNKPAVVLGDDHERIVGDKPDGKVKKQWTIRFDEKQWIDGKFVHPHDACFDAAGNIYVVEWVDTGRITKLTKVA